MNEHENTFGSGSWPWSVVEALRWGWFVTAQSTLSYFPSVNPLSSTTFELNCCSDCSA